ncbi:MAG: response regulator [Gimesia chilikensis]|uniref:response regulator n=1 Tax=Gimesia chilikensis TaxID=2605989 RepID=UPI00378CD00B
MKVLVVDDVGYTCYVHTRLLEELGYEVICASSGFEALSILEQDSEIKIVFSELVMRELDGLDLFLKVQKQERYHDDGQLEAPMYFLMTSIQPGNQTQNRQQERLELAKKLGITGVIYKTRDREELKQAFAHNLKSALGELSEATPVDIYTPAQNLCEAVKDIIETKNLEAAEELFDLIIAQSEYLEFFINSSSKRAELA